MAVSESFDSLNGKQVQLHVCQTASHSNLRTGLFLHEWNFLRFPRLQWINLALLGSSQYMLNLKGSLYRFLPYWFRVNQQENVFEIVAAKAEPWIFSVAFSYITCSHSDVVFDRYPVGPDS